MDPKHKELLDQWHQNLLESITDVDRLAEVLTASGIVSQAERCELEKNCSTSAEKVDLLLKTLMGKEKDHFQDLCAALEKTHPLLYNTLLVNGSGPIDNPAGFTYSVLSTMPSDSESSSSLSSLASSPPTAHVDKPMASEKLDAVVLQLRQVTRERDELRKRLALSSPGTTFDDCRPTVKAAHDYERLKLQCMKAMADLQSLQTQHTHTLKRCQEAMKEADFYHTLHGRVLGEQAGLRAGLRAELEVLRQDYAQLLHTCEDLRRMHDNDQKEVADMRLQHQQALRDGGSSDAVNKLYDAAVEKLEALRKRYGEEVASHSADAGRLQCLEEENARLQKQLDTLLQQREVGTLHPQQHAVRRVEVVHQELSKVCAQNVELQREVERLQSDSTRYKSLQLRAVQEGQRVREERDSVLSEYRLVMSERDQVIKEVERLQTGLEATEAKLKSTSGERREAVEQLEALRQELGAALLDRDRAICERSELLERYSHEVQHKAETQKELSQACREMETAREERDVARKERTEAIIQRDQLLCDYYQAKQEQDSATVDMERVSKEMDVLRKQCEAVTQELKEAVQEAEVAKCRRDWAFQERDKIVAERESVRTLCDNLRRERDRAVSDLADALRNLDDMRKRKNELSRELKELKEHLEEERDKEAHYQPLMAHNSHDSAIDTDSLEWETEVVELERVREDVDLKALGFDVAEGVNDPYLPGDCGVLVTKVDKGGVADGRLRVNDWLLKINDVDLANKDKKQVLKAVLSGGGVINMVVRRRRSLGGRMVTPIHLGLSGSKDSGVVLEAGVFVASVTAGSPAAREASLCLGDRLIAINGIAVENKSLSECETLLRSCRESLSLSVMKFFPQGMCGVTLGESMREYEHGCTVKVPPLEAHMRNYRLSSSGETQSSQQGAPCSTEPFHELCFQRPDPAKRPLTFHPVASGDCITVETVLEKGGMAQKLSGGTWPKMMATPDNTPSLSIFKTKKRKSIFDPDLYKRPETPSKLDYVSLAHMPKHSAQSSRPEGAPQSPPEPPKRSDSFKFKHKQQGSSASDSTITTGTPPATPIQATPSLTPGGRCDLSVEGLDRNGNLLQRQNSGDTRPSTPRRSCEEEVLRQGADELEMRKARMNSAPIRRTLTPLQIPIPLKTPEEACVDAADVLRFCPDRSQKHNVFLQGHHPTTPTPPYPPSRALSPCHAFTTVMRKPVYTAWSHWINNTSAPAPGTGHQHTRPNMQHQARLSLDLTHNPSSDLSDPSSRTRAHHNTHSLPSSARQGLSQYRAERINIPPRPRYTRSSQGSDRGSHSEGSSPSLVTPPLSPLSLDAASFTSNQSQSSLSTQPRLSVSPAPIGERRKERRGCVSAPPLPLSSSPFPQLHTSFSCLFSIRSSRLQLCNRSYGKLPRAARVRRCSLRDLRPYIEEPRYVTIPKGAEPLGISIVGGENGGIFVSKVTGGSIAQRHHLEFGDQLLEFNGINLRNATEQQARLIIGQQCDIITILAQYNPHMYQAGNHSHCSSRVELVSARSTPVGSSDGTPDACSTVDTIGEQEERTPTPPSKLTTHTTRSSLWGCSEGGRHLEPRLVTVRKTQVDLGVKICGGNLRGIYVESLMEDSPAGGADGLQPGDFILELCSVSMRKKTAEEAYLEMLKPAEMVTFRVQKRTDEWSRIRHTPGDGFYIRALYDRMGESERELSFKKDDILYVDDTLPSGNFGYWLAWQLDENGQKLSRGQVPSKYIVEHYPRRCSGTEDEGKTVSAAARRSFFRRKHKHKRSGSRDGKDGPAPDSISTDSVPYTEDCVSLAYQRVQKVESMTRRPVLILGPLVEPIKDMLVREAPGKYCRCLLEVMKASQQAIERGVKDCLFIDYKRRSGHFDVTTVASIKEIIEKDCHCLIDIAPHAIERLHSVSIYPIIVFIRYKNAKQIKEQKDPVYLRDKVSQKHSKEQFEAAQKMEQEYNKYFTGVVQGGSLSSICTQVMAIVEQEQTKALWLPDASV